MMRWLVFDSKPSPLTQNATHEQGFRCKAAAERGFFRALKELRQLEKQAKAAVPPSPAGSSRQELGSFLTFQQLNAQLDVLEARLDRRDAELARTGRSKPAPSPARMASEPRFAAAGGSFDLPFAIGRPR